MPIKWEWLVRHLMEKKTYGVWGDFWEPLPKEAVTGEAQVGEVNFTPAS